MSADRRAERHRAAPSRAGGGYTAASHRLQLPSDKADGAPCQHAPQAIIARGESPTPSYRDRALFHRLARSSTLVTRHSCDTAVGHCGSSCDDTAATAQRRQRHATAQRRASQMHSGNGSSSQRRYSGSGGAAQRQRQLSGSVAAASAQRQRQSRYSGSGAASAAVRLLLRAVSSARVSRRIHSHAGADVQPHQTASDIVSSPVDELLFTWAPAASSDRRR